MNTRDLAQFYLRLRHRDDDEDEVDVVFGEEEVF